MKIKFRFYYYHLPYSAPHYLNLINGVRGNCTRTHPYELIIVISDYILDQLEEHLI